MAVEVRRSTTIGKPRQEVYDYWRRFENLPRFMTHLESVTTKGDGTSHWAAKGPAGTSVEWDAAMVEDRAGELISWRSLDGARVPNSGDVRFVDAPGGRGTEVHVALSYDPPAGAAGAVIAKLFGEEPDQQVREYLRRFKAILETGEAPTTEGQSSGRDAKKSEEPAESAQEAAA